MKPATHVDFFGRVATLLGKLSLPKVDDSRVSFRVDQGVIELDIPVEHPVVLHVLQRGS